MQSNLSLFQSSLNLQSWKFKKIFNSEYDFFYIYYSKSSVNELCQWYRQIWPHCNNQNIRYLMIVLLVFQVIFELCTGSVDRAGNPHRRGISTVGLLELTSSDQLLFILKNYYIENYIATYLIDRTKPATSVRVPWIGIVSCQVLILITLILFIAWTAHFPGIE